MKAKHLKLILGDQLNINHSWFNNINSDDVYVIAELHDEATYTQHHIQKVTAFFAAMADFAKTLESQGHRVCYLTLDDTAKFKNTNDLINYLVKEFACETLTFQRPDEYRLREQLFKLKKQLNIVVNEVDTEHFLLPFEDLPEHFLPQTHVRMETFYRYMRKRFTILMEGAKPACGVWNFDVKNRKTFKQADLKYIPKPLVFNNDSAPYLHRIKKHKINTIGYSADAISYPINREQSLALLDFFCKVQLANFGHFQDAMTMASPYAWSLYHSRLSFSINCKMLSPMEVIDKAIKAYQDSGGKISIEQIEGFIRQILGWREYVRGMYWANMPNYSEQNYLAAKRNLPRWYWTGKTKMNCMKHAIEQSLHYAYAHHIQRLMITGNFALLAGIAPNQVDEWYLGIYIDAIEWVELPNTRSMALFADGGWVATKPYAASGNYINKMSDYCKGCHYKVKEKLKEDACPFNSLYWNFIDTHYQKFSNNQRMSFPVRQWDKTDEAQKIEVRNKATELLDNLNNL